MLLALWSPKGGSGTSVLAAACALVLARDGASRAMRLVDLDGDQPGIFALSSEPEFGVRDWLSAGPETPAEALDRLVVEAAPGVALVPRGGAAGGVLAPVPAAEAGAALAVALRDGDAPNVVDCGRAEEPSARAVVEVADVAFVVVRGCYLTLRRGVRSGALRATRGAVLVEETGRTLGVHEVEEVFDVPVVARVTWRGATARAVDAGVLPVRLPDGLARAAGDVLVAAGLAPSRRGAAA